MLIGKNVKGGVYEDLWVVPGGGIDEGESKVDATKREILEEVGAMRVSSLSSLFKPV